MKKIISPMADFYKDIKQYDAPIDCIISFLLIVIPLIIISVSLVDYDMIFQVFLFFMGWFSWTFFEYMMHRFLMHHPGKQTCLDGRQANIHDFSFKNCGY